MKNLKQDKKLIKKSEILVKLLKEHPDHDTEILKTIESLLDTIYDEFGCLKGKKSRLDHHFGE